DRRRGLLRRAGRPRDRRGERGAVLVLRRPAGPAHRARRVRAGGQRGRRAGVRGRRGGHRHPGRRADPELRARQPGQPADLAVDDVRDPGAAVRQPARVAGPGRRRAAARGDGPDHARAAGRARHPALGPGPGPRRRPGRRAGRRGRRAGRRPAGGGAGAARVDRRPGAGRGGRPARARGR
ncbi:MAG: Phosphonopyruvate decarboxylase, partial [uncultured Corynebacteriales bacterium]